MRASFWRRGQRALLFSIEGVRVQEGGLLGLKGEAQGERRRWAAGERKEERGREKRERLG
jgi:hypothetical protein